MKSCCKDAFEDEDPGAQKKQGLLRRLQAKWRLESWVQMVLVLSVFAIGGSLCAYTGSKLMLLTGLERHAFVYWCVYIPLIALLWPLSVFIVSIPFGQFSFFKKYLAQIGRRMAGRSI